MAPDTPRKIYHRLLVCLFILAFFAPALRMLTTDRINFSFTEKRALADFPSKPESLSQIQSFFSGIDTFLNDHFGFRDFLIFRYQREVRKRFGITGKQSHVYQGTDGWLFLDTQEMLSDYAGRKNISRTDMENWLLKYEEKRAWLSAQGIPYLLVVAPDKKSIYPEYVMEQWRDVHAPGLLQRFVDRYPEIAERELLNLSEILTAHKNDGMIYYKSDTHWTDYGSYIAYLSMAEKIEALIPGISFRKDFSFTEPRKRQCTGKQNNCGDLVRMLLDYEPFEESFRTRLPYKSCVNRSPLDVQISNPPVGNLPSIITRCPDSNFQALVFRDSFFNALEPYFSENFNRTIYLWKSYDQQNMEEILRIFKPDIVVEEIIERNLLK